MNNQVIKTTKNTKPVTGIKNLTSFVELPMCLAYVLIYLWILWVLCYWFGATKIGASLTPLSSTAMVKVRVPV